MYNEKYDFKGTLYRTDYKEEGKNVFLVCEFTFYSDGSEDFSISDVYRNYKDARKDAWYGSDGTEIPLRFQWVADKYIVGSEHICACKYAHTSGKNVVVRCVISSPIINHQ